MSSKQLAEERCKERRSAVDRFGSTAIWTVKARGFENDNLSDVSDGPSRRVPVRIAPKDVTTFFSQEKITPSRSLAPAFMGAETESPCK